MTNPILTTRNPVTMDEIVAEMTRNGTTDGRRFDLRIDSTGRIWSRLGAWAEKAGDPLRDGTVIYSDERRHFDLDKGTAAEYSRNFFGAIVRG